MPAQVRVFYPDGTQAWEYGFEGLVDDGILRVPLPIATNDPTGQWRLTARELCAGRAAATRFEVVD